MKSSWWFRFSFLVIITVISVMALVPTFFKVNEKSSFPFKSKINLCLDLQGGLYMIMGIDFKKVYQDEVKVMVKKAETSLKDKGIDSSVGDADLKDLEDPKSKLIITNIADVEKAKEFIHEYFKGVLRLTGENKNELQWALSREWKSDIEKTAVSKSIEVIRNRIDEFGVTEPEINSQGKDRIVGQLPGVKDIERAKSLIGKTAKLEFKIVNDEIPQTKMVEWMEKLKKDGIEYKKGERYSVYVAKVNDTLRSELPKGFEIAFQKVENKKGELMQNIPYLVESTASLTGDELQDAAVSWNYF